VVPLMLGLVLFGIAFTVARRSEAGTLGGAMLARAGLSFDQALGVNLEILVLLGGVVIPLQALGPIADGVRRRTLTRAVFDWLCGAALVCTLVAPQLILYGSNVGFAIGRYLLPAGLGLAAGAAAGAAWLRRRKYRALYVTSTAIWLAHLIVF